MKALMLSLILILMSHLSLAVPPAYEIHVGPYEESYRTELRFVDTKLGAEVLKFEGEESFPWRPDFSKSPDGRWILLTQKVGSGQNVAWLYTVDDVGRVFRLETAIDELAWNFNDTISGLKFTQLYHTGLNDPTWTDHNTLQFTLSGKNVEESGNGIRLPLEYDLSKGTMIKR